MPTRPEIEPFASGIVVTLAGELDAYDAPALRTAFGEVIETGTLPTVVLDLSRVSFLDSTALGAIVGLLRRIREAGGELRVVMPESEARRVFEITGLDRVLDIRPSRTSATS